MMEFENNTRHQEGMIKRIATCSEYTTQACTYIQSPKPQQFHRFDTHGDHHSSFHTTRKTTLTEESIRTRLSRKATVNEMAKPELDDLTRVI